MNRITTLALFLFISTRLFCQVSATDSSAAGSPSPIQPGKFRYGATLGSEFAAVRGYGSALNTYIQPHFSYGLGKRFAIGGGFSIIQTNYFNARPLFGNETSAAGTGSFTSGVVFVNGQYFVNDRLTIYGSAFKQFPITKDPLPYNPFNPVSSKGAQGIDFNVGYRLGGNIYIQAGFRYTDGINPYYYDPFNRNGSLNDPFGTSPFGVTRW